MLGCSGGYASAAIGPASGYLVRAGMTAVWIDCGSGTLAELQRHVDPRTLAAVVLSHRHPDHCVDLLGLYVHLKYDTDRKALPVFAPREARSALEPLTSGFDDIFAWDTVDDGDTRSAGELTLRFSRTQHPVPTVAVEVAHQATRVVYTSDTGPRWSVAAFGPGADLVVSEATYNSQVSGADHHLTAAQAGAAARTAGAKRLVITHLWPTLDRDVSRAEAADAFGADVTVATPGLSISV